MSTTLVVRVTTNHVPVAPSVGNKTAYQNAAYSLVLPQFFDEDADPLVYSVSNLPPGLSFNASTRTISGTPTTAGTWTVAYSAYDGRVTTTASFTMTVNANHAPVAPTIATQNGTRNTPVYLQLPAFTDSDNDALTYTVSGLPTGLSFNASTRVVTGTPSTTGSWTVTYTANDGRGGVVSTTFTYAIAEPVGNQAPVVTNPLGDVSFTPDTAFDFYFPSNSFADPEGQTLTYTAKKADGTNLPSWLSFVGSTLRFYGTTPSIEFGSWTIRVTATDPSGASVYDDFVFSTTFGGGGGQQQAMSTTFEMGMSEETLSESYATQSSNASGPVAVQVKEQWFTYDALNRIKVSGGVLVAGVPGQSNASIQVAADKYDSYELGYDAVGHLVATYRSYTYNTQSQVHVDWTSYDARGNRQYEFYRQLVGVSDPGVKSQYFYDADNQLVEVRTYMPNDTVKDGPLDGEGFPLYRVDVSGMLLTGQRMQYDADGRLLRQDTLERGEENWWYHPTWSEGAPAAQYNDLSVLSLKERVDYTLTDGTAAWNDTDPTNNASGYDAAGRLVSYRYSAKQNNSFYTHTFTSTFTGWDGWQEATVAGQSTNTSFKPTTNTLTYDGYGRLTQQREHTEYQSNAIDDRIRAYAYNAEGQVQARRDGTWHNSGFVQDTTITSSGAQEKQNYQFVFSAGQQVAELQAGGTVRVAESVNALAQYLSARGAELSPTLTRQMTPTQNNRLSTVTGVAGSGGYTAGGGMVTVLQGETLQGLAQRVYGTSTLWYVLADANGLSDPNAQLTAGVQLKAPSASVNVNDANTFKPYNPSEATGPTTPNLPYIPPPPSSGCSAVAMVLMVVVVIAVSFFTAGALTGLAISTLGEVGSAMLVAGIAGAAGSVAGQAVGSLLGVTSFSWKQVAVDGLVAAATAGVGKGFEKLAVAGQAAQQGSRVAKIASLFTKATDTGLELTTLGRVSQGVAGYLATVEANRIVNHDSGFSWSQVAATVLASYASAKVNPKGQLRLTKGETWLGDNLNRFSGAFVDGAVAGTARRLMGGGKQNWIQIAVNAFGQTIGQNVGERSFAAGTKLSHSRDKGLVAAAVSDGELAPDASEGRLPYPSFGLSARSGLTPQDEINSRFGMRALDENGFEIDSDEHGLIAGLGEDIAMYQREAAARTRSEPITIRTQKGDTPDIIAERVYGDRRVAGVVMAAAGIRDPRKLRAGIELDLPALDSMNQEKLGESLRSMDQYYLAEDKRKDYQRLEAYYRGVASELRQQQGQTQAAFGAAFQEYFSQFINPSTQHGLNHVTESSSSVQYSEKYGYFCPKPVDAELTNGVAMRAVTQQDIEAQARHNAGFQAVDAMLANPFAAMAYLEVKALGGDEFHADRAAALTGAWTQPVVDAGAVRSMRPQPDTAAPRFNQANELVLGYKPSPRSLWSTTESYALDWAREPLRIAPPETIRFTSDDIPGTTLYIRNSRVVANSVSEPELRTIADMNFAEGHARYTDGMSDKAFTKLVNSIRENGLQNPVIEYVEIDGVHYVARGNNRMMAAQALGKMDELKFMKVEFPVPKTNWRTSQDILDASGTVRPPKVRK